MSDWNVIGGRGHRVDLAWKSLASVALRSDALMYARIGRMQTAFASEPYEEEGKADFLAAY
jgi:hypothetical protein